MDLIEKCLICKSNRFEELRLNSKDERLINICQSCGYGRRKEIGFESNISTQLAADKERVVVPCESQIRWPRRPALVAQQIGRYLGRGKVLDIGCGNGMNLKALPDSWEKYGIELSPAVADAAREFTGAQIYTGKYEEYQAQENSYNLVMAHALIEHLFDPQAFVKWCYRILEPGGYLVLMTGDRESKVARKMGQNWPLYRSDDHVSYFSARSIRVLLELVGFEVVREEWRFMYYANSAGSSWDKKYERVKEILGLITKPISDHYYCYAVKRGS